MNIKLTLLIIILFFTFQLSAQNNQLISSFDGDLPLNQPAVNFLMQQPGTASVKFINLNLDILNDFDDFQLSYDNKNYTVNYDRIEQRSYNNYSWFGSNTDGSGYIIISVLDNDVQGIIRIGIETYRIFTTIHNAKVVVKIDQSEYPQEACFIQNPSQNKPLNPPGNANSEKPNALRTALATGCNMRALIMYTQAAEDGIKSDEMVTNIRNTIQIVVNETNLSFENSDIADYNPIEIVLLSKSNLTETNDLWADLTAFKTSTEVLNLKDTYNADFCAFITDFTHGLCGTISRPTSSLIVPYTCMLDQFSFAHELGHLLGADHNVEDRNPTIVYPDGCGYIYAPGKWVTIMSYQNVPPCDNSCRRQAFWSNPFVDHPVNNVPMGRVNLENNARVCRLNFNTLSANEQPENSFTLSNTTYNNNNSLSATIEAIQTINTNGSVIVQDESSLSLKAGQNIRLNTNFKAKANSRLKVYIDESIDDCE